MRRRLICLLLLCAASFVVVSQNAIPPRANVVAYDDEDGIMKLDYRQSPYFREIAGSWKQRHTDSSLIYTTQLDVSKSWKYYKVYLNVRCGRACRVSLNGKEVGYGDDSRHWNEFLLDSQLKYGKSNTLTIEALKSPRGALLEDSTIGVGLNGEPYLLFKTDPCIADMDVVGDYEPASKMGTLTLGATVFNSKKKGKYYVDVEVWGPNGRQLDRMGRWVIFDNRTEETVELSRTWGGVEAWSAETPTLYTAVVRLRNEKMEEEELVGARFGFRRVQVDDGVLKVNGKTITLRGVTYGIEHTEGYASRQQMQRDVAAMKQNNINAVRTAGYSPMDPYFYELCDQQGLYVVADANLMPLSSQHHAVATDQDFAPLFEQRVQNLYGRYKNHSSIIAWSLGNSTDNGVCMTAAYRRLKQMEKNRPVVFPAAGYSENTDIIVPVHPTAEALRQSLEKGGERPVINLGADAGQFEQLARQWRLVTTQRQLQGCFVERWPLGSAQLSELKHLYSPFTIRQSKITQDEGEFVVTNNNDFSTFAAYMLDYTIFTNIRPNIISGDLPVAAPGGESDKVRMRIPSLALAPGEEMFIRFNVSRRPQAGQKTSEVGSLVFPLQRSTAPKVPLQLVGDTLAAVAHGDTATLMSAAIAATYDASSATMLSYAIDGAAAPLAQHSPMLRFKGFESWRATVVATSERRPDQHTQCFDAMLRYVNAAGSVMCDVRQTTTIYSSGDVVVAYTFSPTDKVRSALKPEIVVKRGSSAEGDSLLWFGLDREVLLRDNNSGIVGTCSMPMTKAPTTALGTRLHVRWCAVAGQENGLFLRLLDRQATMSFGQMSIVLVPEDDCSDLRLLMKAYPRAGTGINPTDFLAVEYPTMASAILDPPTITASSPRFSQPLTVTLSTVTIQLPTEIRYTLDGTEPTDESPLYTEPFIITATTVVKARTFQAAPTPEPKLRSKGKKPVPVDTTAKKEQMAPSFTATRKFNYDHIVRTTFSRKPNTPYNVGTDTILFDGQTGDIDDLTRGWLGFSGEAVVTVVELAKPVATDAVTLRYAHSPALWAFAPDSVLVTFSADGTNYGDAATVAVPFNPSEQEQSNPQLVELRVPAPQGKIGFIKIEPRTIGRIPAWHRAKGLKPWLMMDEIQIEEHIQVEN